MGAILALLMYGSEGSHSGTLMYGSDASHSGTLMYGSEGEPFWHANVWQ